MAISAVRASHDASAKIPTKRTASNKTFFICFSSYVLWVCPNCL
jgi:hypothetical protein